jgi:hypothetical protein
MATAGAAAPLQESQAVSSIKCSLVSLLSLLVHG